MQTVLKSNLAIIEEDGKNYLNMGLFEESQAHIQSLLKELEYDDEDNQNQEVKFLMNSMDSLLDQFSTNHVELQNEMNSILESSKNGLLSHEAIAELILQEQTRSNYLVNVTGTLKYQLDKLCNVIREKLQEENGMNNDELGDMFDNMNILDKSINSMSKVITSPQKTLNSTIKKIDSQLMIHLNNSINLHGGGYHLHSTRSPIAESYSHSPNNDSSKSNKKVNKSYSTSVASTPLYRHPSDDHHRFSTVTPKSGLKLNGPNGGVTRKSAEMKTVNINSLPGFDTFNANGTSNHHGNSGKTSDSINPYEKAMTEKLMRTMSKLAVNEFLDTTQSEMMKDRLHRDFPNKFPQYKSKYDDILDRLQKKEQDLDAQKADLELQILNRVNEMLAVNSDGKITSMERMDEVERKKISSSQNSGINRSSLKKVHKKRVSIGGTTSTAIYSNKDSVSTLNENPQRKHSVATLAETPTQPKASVETKHNVNLPRVNLKQSFTTNRVPVKSEGKELDVKKNNQPTDETETISFVSLDDNNSASSINSDGLEINEPLPLKKEVESKPFTPHFNDSEDTYHTSGGNQLALPVEFGPIQENNSPRIVHTTESDRKDIGSPTDDGLKFAISETVASFTTSSHNLLASAAAEDEQQPVQKSPIDPPVKKRHSNQPANIPDQQHRSRRSSFGSNKAIEHPSLLRKIVKVDRSTGMQDFEEYLNSQNIVNNISIPEGEEDDEVDLDTSSIHSHDSYSIEPPHYASAGSGSNMAKKEEKIRKKRKSISEDERHYSEYLNRLASLLKTLSFEREKRFRESESHVKVVQSVIESGLFLRKQQSKYIDNNGDWMIPLGTVDKFSSKSLTSDVFREFMDQSKSLISAMESMQSVQQVLYKMLTSSSLSEGEHLSDEKLNALLENVSHSITQIEKIIQAVDNLNDGGYRIGIFPYMLQESNFEESVDEFLFDLHQSLATAELQVRSLLDTKTFLIKIEDLLNEYKILNTNRHQALEEAYVELARANIHSPNLGEMRFASETEEIMKTKPIIKFTNDKKIEQNKFNVSPTNGLPDTFHSSTIVVTSSESNKKNTSKKNKDGIEKVKEKDKKDKKVSLDPVENVNKAESVAIKTEEEDEKKMLQLYASHAGGLLVTRTYKEYPPEQTLHEAAKEASNPLFLLYLEFKEFLPKIFQTRLLTASIVEGKITKHIPDSSPMKKLYEAMLSNIKHIEELGDRIIVTVNGAERCIVNLIAIRQATSENIIDVDTMGQEITSLYTSFGEIESMKMEIDLHLHEYRTVFDSINSQGIHSISNLSKESVEFSQCYKSFLKVQGESLEAFHRLQAMKDRCIRYKLTPKDLYLEIDHKNSESYSRQITRDGSNQGLTSQPKQSANDLSVPLHAQKPSKIIFSDEYSSHGNPGEEYRSLIEEIDNLRFDLENADQEIIALEDELFQALQNSNTSPGALLFFSILNDPAYISCFEQLILQLTALKPFVNASAHIDYLTLKKKMQSCVTTIPTLEKLINKYGMLFNKWTNSRINWFAERNLSGGAADSYSLCPLCFKNLTGSPKTTEKGNKSNEKTAAVSNQSRYNTPNAKGKRSDNVGRNPFSTNYHHANKQNPHNFYPPTDKDLAATVEDPQSNFLNRRLAYRKARMNRDAFMNEKAESMKTQSFIKGSLTGFPGVYSGINDSYTDGSISTKGYMRSGLINGSRNPNKLLPTFNGDMKGKYYSTTPQMIPFHVGSGSLSNPSGDDENLRNSVSLPYL